MSGAIQEHLAAAKSANAALNRLAKSAPISARHDLLRQGLTSLEKAVDGLEKRFAAEAAGQYASAPYFDGEKARIAALEAELAELRKRASADSALSGLVKTLSRGAATNLPDDAENPLTSASGERERN
jgi:hypothetical protein